MMLRSMISRPETLPVSLPRLDRQFDELVERIFRDGGDQLGLTRFMPSMNVSENDSGYEVTAELAGMQPADVQIEMKGSNLWITGDKKEEKDEQGKTFHRVERRHGEFRRVVRLPAATTAEHVKASFENGVLKILVPKDEQVKPTRIPISG